MISVKKLGMITRKKLIIRKFLASSTAAGIFRATTGLLAQAALLLCSPSGPDGLAQAQVFVSNARQPAGDSGIPFYYDHAQAFTTGSDSDGYTLASVDIYFSKVFPNPTYSVGIWTSGLGGRPSIPVGSLSLPATLVVGTNRFTTSGIDLDAETTYLVVVNVDNDSFDTIHYTASSNEDTGGTSGWSIDNSLYKETGRGWEIGLNFMRIRINGPIPPSADPTPTDLTTPTAPDSDFLTYNSPNNLDAREQGNVVNVQWSAPPHPDQVDSLEYRVREGWHTSNASHRGDVVIPWTRIDKNATSIDIDIHALTSGERHIFYIRSVYRERVTSATRTNLPVVHYSSVSTENSEIPEEVSLGQNYPNPFNPGTSISWTQPVSGQIRLSVYNLLGQNMATLVDGLRPAGEHEVRLDASGWPGGMYVYVLETGTHTLTRRMVLLK